MTDADEDEKLASILKKPEFQAHGDPWTQAYADYRKAQGDPWQIGPASFQPDIRDLQLNLYLSRKSGGPLKRIRNTVGIRCCPMCGYPGTGSLDHYLPRETYPEFSVFPSNLLPACSPCNSGAKGRTYKGAGPGERFLHPYFDTIAAGEVWRIRIDGRPDAPLYQPVPEPGLAEELWPMVEFHLAHVFGDAFETGIDTIWDNLPVAMADGVQNLGLSGAEALLGHYRETVRSYGLNGWRAALLRGLNANEAALAHVSAEAAKVKLPEINF